LSDLFSEIILEYYKEPINFGKIKEPNLTGRGGNISCGDTIELYITFDGSKVKNAMFEGQGCAISRAGSCILTEKIKGMEVNDILKIQADEIFEELGGVIQTRAKCALLALHVIKKSLEDWKNNPVDKMVVKDVHI